MAGYDGFERPGYNYSYTEFGKTGVFIQKT
jgi:hypothetical protein